MKKVILVFLLIFTACSTSKKSSNYNFIKGLNDYQRMDKVSALKNYKEAYEKDKKNVSIIKEIGFLYADLGDYKEAENYYLKAFEIDNYDENILQNLLIIYEKNNDIEKIKKYSSKILDKNSFLYNYYKLKLGMMEENYRESKVAILNIFSKNENLSKDYNNNLYRNIEKLYSTNNLSKDEYSSILEKAYSKYSDNKKFMKIYSNFLMENKEYGKAKEILIRYILNNENNLEELKLLEKIAYFEKDKETIKKIKKIIEKKNGRE